MENDTNSPRELVENTFKELGFNNENPDDLDMVTELLEIWKSKEPEPEYTPEQYILLNDPDVVQVLNRCKQYYEPKRHLSKNDLRKVLEDIAIGKITRQDYDFKNGKKITIEPTFTERIQAIKMLQEGADDDNKQATVQFINNIISQDSSASSQTSPVTSPNLDAPDGPPPDHYSLNILESSELDGDM